MEALMKAEEVAELLALPTRTVYRLAWQGRLPSVKVGERCVRFDPVDIREYIDGRRRSVA
jgi:excisionase family DNA binding protein